MAAEVRYPYEIVSRWRVPGSIEQVFDVLTDAPSLPAWWPEAYSEVRELAPGDARGIGRMAEIVTRGFLPYSIRWRIEATEIRRPDLIRVRASGDLSGVGEWRLAEDGRDVVLAYDWRVRVEKPWMRRIEALLKPAFVINHNHVMRRGEKGLRAELARRG